MKIQLFILIYVLTLSLVFCQEQENVNIEKVLNNQLEYGASAKNEVTDIPTGYIFTEEDVNVESTVIRKILDNNGYKANQTDFNDKITKIFGTKQINPFYINTLEGKCNINTKLNHDIFDFPSAQIYVIPNKQIIFPILLLPQLIDYQKDYPKTALVEDKINKSFVKDDYKVNLKLWREVKDLSKQRRFNQQLLIARNKYLFNDDPSQFVWLTNNDKDFMESLVTTFGYTEDKKLLKWVIDNTDLDYFTLRANSLLNFNELGSLFWTKNCDGKLKLHPNTFKMFQELYKPNDNSTMRFLLDYIAGYLNYLLDKDNYNGILTEEDKVKIGANLVYFAEQYKYNPKFKDSNRMMGRFRYFTSEDYDGILKKNNYYNLPKFKEWWDKAEYDEDFVRECEYDGTCGRDNPQPDPTNPKYKNSF